jgi:hypothetical protein
MESRLHAILDRIKGIITIEEYVVILKSLNTAERTLEILLPTK